MAPTNRYLQKRSKPTNINLTRLALKETQNIRYGLRRYLYRMEALASDVDDFESFDGGPNGPVDLARRSLMRKLDQIENQIIKANW